MSKIKIKLKLQGLELEVEGERADLPAITQGLKQQLGGIIQAPATVIGVETVEPRTETPVLQVGNGDGKVRKRKTRTANSGGGDDQGSAAVDFRHDSQKWGTPTQEWTTLEKAMWLLYAVANQTIQKELSSGSVAATFNKHFRQAKEVLRGNVHRDLGKAKVQTPSLVGEDSSKSPSVWYLTNEGNKSVQQLLSKQGIGAVA
jgi:hypothetical protein